jgi:D-beta-D-heptose 7-phosphate kinase/D-beta-D-heptose 1-phosphate adenosyltransferase
VLAGLEAVDLVVVFEQDTPLELIREVKPMAVRAAITNDQVVGRGGQGAGRGIVSIWCRDSAPRGCREIPRAKRCA